jgi:predicted nucleotidyltransferase
MNKQAILDRLRENERALRERGVILAALFGSRARGDGFPGSDIDIMIEIEPQANIGLFEYVGIKHYLEDLFPMRVDVTNRGYLKPLVRPNAERDAIYAF